MTTLLQEIYDKCTPELIASRDEAAIATILSTNRTKIVKTLIGKGIIIQEIGLQAANPLLDYIDSSSDFRHIKQLLANGELDISASLARMSLQGMQQAGLISQESCDTLLNLAVVPDTISPNQVAEALEGVK